MHNTIGSSGNDNILRAGSVSRNFAKGLAVLALATSVALPLVAQTGGAYKVTNIISDGSVPAITTDPNFINPWGISGSPTWWINANGTGYNYVVPPAGTIAFKVIIPAASGVVTATGQPTGSVTTAGANGMLLPNGTKASFLFSTTDGIIAGWNSKLGTANAISQVAINNSAANAAYTDLAIFTNATNSYILAANFGAGSKVEVYDSTFKPTTLAGTFTDPNLPANYAPYSIHIIGTQVFIAYAQRLPVQPYDEIRTPGSGIVSVFDLTGAFIQRAVTGGNLNTPWGVAIAPANFGIYSKDLLVGNFGDGYINVYDPKTFAYLGQMMDGTGKPLVYLALWDLLAGGTVGVAPTTPPVSGGDPSTVYFTAGLAGEAHGLFAGIANDPLAAGSPTFGMSTSTSAATVTVGNSTAATVSVAPANNFAGTVTLSCSGLPVGTTCTFAPAQMLVTAIAPATGTVTIQTTKGYASLTRPRLRQAYESSVAWAVLLPFSALLLFRRRSSRLGTQLLRLFGFALVLVAFGSLTGCGGYTAPAIASTPAGQSKVVVSATSGAITQQTTINLTVQ